MAGEESENVQVINLLLKSRKGGGSTGATFTRLVNTDGKVEYFFAKVGEKPEYGYEVVRALIIQHLLHSSKDKFFPLKTPKIAGLLKNPPLEEINALFRMEDRPEFSGNNEYLGATYQHIDAEVDTSLIVEDPKRYAQAVCRALRTFPELNLNEEFAQKYKDQKIFPVKTFETYQTEFNDLVDKMFAFADGVGIDVEKNNSISQLKEAFSSYKSLTPDKLSFVHSDLSWHNLVVESSDNPEGDEVWIFDFEKSCVGITWEDWARFLNYSISNPAIYEEVVSNLTAEEKRKVKIFQLYKYFVILDIFATQYQNSSDERKEVLLKKLKKNFKLVFALLEELKLESKT